MSRRLASPPLLARDTSVCSIARCTARATATVTVRIGGHDLEAPVCRKHASREPATR